MEVKIEIEVILVLPGEVREGREGGEASDTGFLSMARKGEGAMSAGRLASAPSVGLSPLRKARPR